MLVASSPLVHFDVLLVHYGALVLVSCDETLLVHLMYWCIFLHTWCTSALLVYFDAMVHLWRAGTRLVHFGALAHFGALLVHFLCVLMHWCTFVHRCTLGALVHFLLIFCALWCTGAHLVHFYILLVHSALWCTGAFYTAALFGHFWALAEFLSEKNTISHNDKFPIPASTLSMLKSYLKHR